MEEHSELMPPDPEIERTLARRRKAVREQLKLDHQMGEQQPLLRDLWIPNH